MIKYRENVDKNLLHKSLTRKLDLFERYCDIDVEATSGLRTPERNAEVGGSPTSSHLKGLAIDFAYQNGVEAQKILNCARWANFTRIGFGKTHIHLDTHEEKPQNCFWWEK